MSGRLLLVGGGVRSGKSAFALDLLRARGKAPLFIATAEPVDDDMRARIARHRRDRGEALRTLEEPLALPEALAREDAADVVLIDCLTVWLGNLLVRGSSENDILARVDALLEAARARSGITIAVTNEVGLGIHPESALGRAFADIAGRAHQILARAADEIYFAVLGTVLRLKPPPIEAMPPLP